jgi:hypothetical protein
MAKMHQLVEEMHARLTEISASEQALLRTLRDALNRADAKLMQEVRTITAEHDTRRRAVLGELQSLAARLDTFPTQREPVPELTVHPDDGAWPEGLVEEDLVEEDLPRAITRHAQQRPNAANITTELELYFKARAS